MIIIEVIFEFIVRIFVEIIIEGIVLGVFKLFQKSYRSVKNFFVKSSEHE